MQKVSKDDDQPVRIVRKGRFLLSELFRPDEKRDEHKKVYHEFRKLLAQLKEYMEEKSQLMGLKKRNLQKFTTIIRVWENETPDTIAREIKSLKIDSKYGFLIYKISSGWNIKGITITGQSIDHSIDLIPQYQSHYSESLLEKLRDKNTNEQLLASDPLHKLIVEYFGYYRPSMFVSYSWPSPEYQSTFQQDSNNKRDIHKLAKDLECAGFRVLIDKDDLSRGDNIDRFIDLIDGDDTDYVCIMGTPLYKRKYDQPTLFLGGESNKTYVEAKSIIHRANTKPDFDQRIVTLLIDGEESTSFPAQLKNKIFCKLSENDYFNTFISLFFTLYRYKDPMKDKNIKEMIKEFNNKVRPVETSQVILTMKNKPVIIFTDPGVDDLAALGLALAPNAFTEIKAIVACAGNIERDKTLQNVIDICYLANRKDFPILRGSEKSINGDLIKTDYEAHGDNGLNGIKLEKSLQTYVDCSATDFIIECLRHSRDPITLISLAGLTDVALVLEAAQQHNLLDKVAGISMMGGVFDPRQANAPKANLQFPIKYGEFNFLCDPDATQKTFEICGLRKKPIPVILFDLTFTHQYCRFTQSQTVLLRKNPQNKLSITIADALDVIPAVYKTRFSFSSPSQPAHDVFPVMALIEENLFEGEYVNIRCQTSKDSYPGKVEIVADDKCPKIFLLTAIQPNKEQAFFDKYAEMLSRYTPLSTQKIAVESGTPLAPQPSKAQTNDASSHTEAGSPRFFDTSKRPKSETSQAKSSQSVTAATTTNTTETPPPESSPKQRNIQIKKTQVIASVPGDINPAILDGILDVAHRYAPPKFQTKEPGEEISVTVIVRDDNNKSSTNNSSYN